MSIVVGKSSPQSSIGLNGNTVRFLLRGRTGRCHSLETRDGSQFYILSTPGKEDEVLFVDGETGEACAVPADGDAWAAGRMRTNMTFNGLSISEARKRLDSARTRQTEKGEEKESKSEWNDVVRDLSQYPDWACPAIRVLA